MTQPTLGRFWRQAAAIAAIPVAGSILLTGCSSGSSAGSGANGGPVTLKIAVQTQTNETKPYSTIVDEFNKQSDDIKVELTEYPNEQYAQTIKTQLQAGNAPDLIYGSPGTGNPNSLGLYAQAGQLVDLSGEDWAAAAVPDSAKNIYYVDNQLVGVPLDVAPIPSIINETAYQELGLEPATTFADVLKQCKTVRDAGKNSLITLSGTTPPNTGIMALQLAATRVYAQDPDWNTKRTDGKVSFADTQGWKDTLQAILDLKTNECFQDGAEGGTFDTLFNEVSSGKSLSFFGPGGSAADLASINPNAEFGTAAFPGKSASDEFVFASPTNALGINAASKNVDAAKTFLKFWEQKDQLNKFASLTGNVSLASVQSGEAVSNERYSRIEEYLTDPKKNAPLANLFWPNGDVYTALGVGVQGLLTGQASIDQVLQSMDSAWG
ncbi:Carbohydrate ABC transporter substrate-binding protein, CUT1 family [Arthrobacter sp. 9AX]|uniref:ABC transporter substrate-binding protein n=1 Tax=Arthrobacter sp. 9AX TaxID=2653131 RepID=UPI0012EF0D83|nr:extracellular solute-binding protein [Arthrobacter sp. 9AX]VXC24420.1 Carbohydrate ABC transporter substrate-binding protein, CUT1 family [Arthrobacter sp. 9AX]